MRAAPIITSARRRGDAGKRISGARTRARSAPEPEHSRSGASEWRRRSFVSGPAERFAGYGTLLLFLTTGPAWADGLNVDTELSYTGDSNVKRAQSGPDVVSDRALALGINLGGALPISTHTRLVSRAFVRGERFSTYDTLSNAPAGAGADFQYRSSGHPLAPTFGAFIKVSVAEFRSEIRSSTFYTGGLSFSKNLTDRVLTSVILSGTARDSDSAVFDTREGSALLNLDYQLRGGSAWYLSYNFLTGDTVSSGAPTLQIVARRQLTRSPKNPAAARCRGAAPRSPVASACSTRRRRGSCCR